MKWGSGGGVFWSGKGQRTTDEFEPTSEWRRLT
jgi:hypothetical protein